MRLTIGIAAAILMFAFAPATASAERLKDITDIMGARSNQLVGYGIVVGLASTGDGRKAEFTLQSVAAMLRRLGVRINPAKVKLKNAAAVIVTAEFHAFARPGQEIDVIVSSMGDAKSLRGGTLIQTPLLGADRKVYAVAQGPVLVGGFSAGTKGASKTSGHPTVGRIPEGAIVEAEIPTSISLKNVVNIALKQPDPKTASRIVNSINSTLGGSYAKANDPGLISVKIPPGYKGKPVQMLAHIGDITVVAEPLAKVVINERTGTVVIGTAVTLRPSAVAHGGLTVEIRDRNFISQPETPFGGGTTISGEDTELYAGYAPGNLHIIPRTATVGELVGALNKLGVKPADLIVIFQTLAAAGALSADIEVQ